MSASRSARQFATIATHRLLNQRITQTELRRPADVVRWLGAVQAQEYEPAKWGLALRLADGIVDATVERAFTDGQILRTHVMRPTWHFVTPADIRWLLALTAPRVHRILSSYNRHLELDTRLLVRGTHVMERALRDRTYLTRKELGERLRRANVNVEGMRLATLAMYAELEGVICSGPRRGTQFTYALIADRAPVAKTLPRDEALATLARRYFSSHGPATIRDFVWWSGLTTVDAKRGLEMNRANGRDVDGRTYWTIGDQPPPAARRKGIHLLPIYDEYLVSYRDRDAVPHRNPGFRSSVAGVVTFRHALMIAGRVAGTWRISRGAKAVRVGVFPHAPLGARDRTDVNRVIRRYERFLGRPVEVVL